MSITMKSIEHGIFQGPLNCWPLAVAGRNTKKKTTNRANRRESIREDSRDSSFFLFFADR